MSSTGAFFDSFEEMFLKYIGQREESLSPGATFPGMTSKPRHNKNFIRLCKSDPRAIVYPNFFANSAGRNATFEPTAAEYQSYASVSKNATATEWDVVETVLGNGIWQLKNKTQIQFAVPGGASTGCTLTHAILCFQGDLGGIFSTIDHYGILAAELSSDIIIPNGGGGSGPLIDVGELVFGEATFA